MAPVRLSPSAGPASAEITGIYEPDTGSIQYVCTCPQTGKCALIDVVLNFNPKSAATSTEALDEVLGVVEDKGYEVAWILDTHPHADHFMASATLKEKLGVPNAIGEKVREIAGLWREYYHLPGAFEVERDFDRLFADGDTFSIGELPVRVKLSPGHTLGSITYIVGEDAAFVHDTFMQPDAGTARVDFPGGSASDLYDSLMAILSLPDDTRLFVGHDYGTDERPEPAWQSSVAVHREQNIHVGGGVLKQDYMARREKRDATLRCPTGCCMRCR